MRFPLKVSFLSLSSSSSSFLVSSTRRHRHRHHHRSQRWQRKKTIRFVLLLVCVVYVFPTRNRPTLIVTLLFDLNNDFWMKNSFVLISRVLWSSSRTRLRKMRREKASSSVFVTSRVCSILSKTRRKIFERRDEGQKTAVWGCRGAKKSIILFHAYMCGFDQTIKLLFFVLSLSRFAMSVLRLEGGGGGGQNVKFVKFVVVERRVSSSSSSSFSSSFKTFVAALRRKCLPPFIRSIL